MAIVEQRFLGIAEAKTTGEFLAELSRFSASLGFGTCDAAAFQDHGTHVNLLGVVDTIPRHTDWLAVAHLGRICPVQQHCRTRSDPVLWGSRTYGEKAVRPLYDVCSSLGLASGISIAAHLPGGRIMQLSAHGDSDLKDGPMPMAMVKEFQKFSWHAMLSARRLFLPARPSDEFRALTELEKELLRLAGADIPLDIIANRLSLSVADAETCRDVAMASLRCSSPKEAALVAYTAGII